MNLDAESVKGQADIARVIGQFLELKKGGAGELVGLCPFHKEKSPSFTVTPGRQMYYCFGCEAGGDVFDFIKKLESTTFNGAVQRVAEICGVAVPADKRGSHSEAATAKARQSKAPEPSPSKSAQGRVVATYPYPDEHGELLYEVQRVEPGSNGKAKEFRQRRPHPLDGAWVWGVAAGAYRKRSNGEWYPVKGEAEPDDDELPEVTRVLFRLPEILKAEVVYVVEGEKDVLTLEKLGLVATTNSGGAAQKWLPQYSEALRGRRVIVIPDNDDPGKKRGAHIAKELAGIAADVLPVELPAGKDVTDFIESGRSAADLSTLVEAARRQKFSQELERRGLLSPSEIVINFEGGINAFLDPSKRAPGLNTGFARLDEMTLGLHKGELFILAARPSQGKTAMAMNIAANVAERGSPVAVFSLEMSRESILSRVVCARARVDGLKFRAGYCDRNERMRLSRALTEISGFPLFIDDNAAANLPNIHRKLTAMKAERGLGLVVVDYLQLMSSTGKENRNQEVSALSRGLKLMARELDVPFVVLSQLSRAGDSQPGNRRPQLSDLRDSGSIEQDADTVGFIYREEMYKPDRPELRGLAKLILAKQRNGPTGTIDLVYLHSFTKFENAAHAEHE